MDIQTALTVYNLSTGAVSGQNTSHAKKKISEISNIFADQTAAAELDPDTVVYEVSTHAVVPEGTPGGLFFGTSCVHAGKVGNEYFMTKGHFHARRETAEYYWGISGKGVLLLMDEHGNCTAQSVEKGSLHYIGGHIAHRLINIADEDLLVGACWPSDAGHDYGSIASNGFPVRIISENGKTILV